MPKAAGTRVDDANPAAKPRGLGPNDVTLVGRVAHDDTRDDTGVDVAAVAGGADIDDGLSALVGFHDEIRAALLTLDQVAGGDERDVDVIKAFLTGPLTWHDEDEEVTLLARLRRRRVWSPQLTHVQAGHEKLEDLLDELVPLLDDPGAHRATVKEMAARLRALMVGHLRLEEEFLFPLVRQTFDAAALREMGDEIAARHARRQGRVTSARPSTTKDLPPPPPLATMTGPAEAPTALATPVRFTVGRALTPTAAATPRHRPLPATAAMSLLSLSGSAVDDDDGSTVQ